ncbi:YdcF family protein [Aquirufa echingensis]|uniref:YdcF family protein n=1 Tax=Aquirufa echingensis TaxID=3096516 RepID=A0ABW6D0G8_9BACT
MFFTLSKIIDFLLLPITWIILSACLIAFTKRQKIKTIAGIFLISLLILGSNTLIVNSLYSAYEIPQTQAKNHYPLAIVLGGGMIREPQEDPSRINVGESADRFMQAALLYKQGMVDQILITGGNTSIGNLKIDQSNETEQVKRILVAMAIPADKIIMEKQAKNTYENARNCRAIIDSLALKQPAVLITSAYHMRRSMACFSKQGIQVIPYSVDSKKKDTQLGVLECIIPSERELYKLSVLVREMFGFVIYRIMGYA